MYEGDGGGDEEMEARQGAQEWGSPVEHTTRRACRCMEGVTWSNVLDSGEAQATEATANPSIPLERMVLLVVLNGCGFEPVCSSDVFWPRALPPPGQGGRGPEVPDTGLDS